jgi:hypothetical protein
MTTYIVYRTAEHGRQANQEHVFLCDAEDATDAMNQAQANARGGGKYTTETYRAVPVSTLIATGGKFLRGDVQTSA